jgi:hypothetical protein
MKVITSHAGMESLDEGAPAETHGGDDNDSEHEVDDTVGDQTEKDADEHMEPVPREDSSGDYSDDDSVYGMVVEPGALCAPCLQKVQSENAVQFVLENTEVTEIVPVGGLVHFTEGDYGGTVRVGTVLRRQVLYDVQVDGATFWQVSPEGFGMVPVVTSSATGKVAMGPSVNRPGKPAARSGKHDKRKAPEKSGRNVGGKEKKQRKSAMQKAEEEGLKQSMGYIGKAILMRFSDNGQYASVVGRYDTKTMKYYSFFDGYPGQPKKEYAYTHEKMLKSLITKKVQK